MIVKQINVSVRFTKYLGNYQTYVSEAGMVVDLEPGDDRDVVYKSCFAEAREQVRQQAMSVKSQAELQQVVAERACDVPDEFKPKDGT